MEKPFVLIRIKIIVILSVLLHGCLSSPSKLDADDETNFFLAHDDTIGMKKLFISHIDPQRRILKSYWSKDVLMGVSYFTGSKKDGKSTLYSNNGKIWVEGCFEKGNEQGEFRYYDTTGKLEERIFYKDGKELSIVDSLGNKTRK